MAFTTLFDRKGEHRVYADIFVGQASGTDRFNEVNTNF